MTLGNYSDFAQLNVEGLSGADTFKVYTGRTYSRTVYINGSLPSGKAGRRLAAEWATLR